MRKPIFSQCLILATLLTCFSLHTFAANGDCQPMTNFALQSVTTNSATFTWTAANDETEWYIRYKTQGSTRYTSVSRTQTNLTIDHLRHSTLYTLNFVLYARCGETLSADSIVTNITFQTECAPFTITDTLRFGFEEFSTNTDFSNVPCWTLGIAAGNYGSVSPSGKIVSTYAHSGANSMYIYGTYNASKVALLITPEITLPENYEFIAYAREGYSHYNQDSIQFYINSTPSLTGATYIGSLTDLSTSYKAERMALTGFSGKTYILAKVYAYSNIYFDDFTFQPLPNCLPPTNLQVSAVTGTDATISWSAGGSETEWHITYSTPDQEVEGEEVVTGTPEFTIEDKFEPSHAYTLNVTVKAVCDGVESTETLQGTLNFATECDPITDFMWTEDFEGLTQLYTIPVCWDNQGGSTTDPTYRFGALIGENNTCLQFNSNSNPEGYTNLLKTPVFELPEQPMVFTFDWKAPDGGTLDVYVSTDNGTTLIPAKTNMKYQTSWKNEEISLAAYTNQSVVVVFKGTSNFAFGDAYVYIDNCKIDEAPDCMAPANIFIDAIDTTSAIIRWTPALPQNTVFNVEILRGTNIVFSGDITGTSYTLTGLTKATEYTYSVRVATRCDDQSLTESLSRTFTFYTACDVITSFPWTEDFDNFSSGTIDTACWVNEHSAGTYTTLYSISAGNSGKGVYLNAQPTGNQVRLTLPEMNIPADGEYELVFDLYRGNTATAFIGEGFYITSGVDTLAFAPLGFSRSSQQIPAEEAMGWYTYRLTIPHAGVQAISMEMIWKNGYFFNVDNLIVRRIPSCYPASDLYVSNITTNSAKLIWTRPAEGGDLFQVVVKNGESVLVDTQVNGNSCIVPNLNPSTDYNLSVSITTICAEDDMSSPYQTTARFSTECGPIATPYAVNYATLNSLATCWTNVEGSVNVTYSTNYNALRLNGGTSDKVRTVALPEMIDNVNTMMLTIVTMNTPDTQSSDYGDIIVGVMTSPTQASTFTAIQTIAQSVDPLETEVDLSAAPANAKYVAIRYANGTASGNAYIRSILLETIPTCAKVQAITRTAVTGESATFAWTPGGEEQAWIVSVTNGTNTLIDAEQVNEPSIEVGMLEPNTDYTLTISVAAKCDDENLSPARTAELSFHTTPADNAAINLNRGNTFVVDFGAEDEQDKWLLSAEGQNQFIFGTDASALAQDATHALYVSNNAGTWNYLNTSASAAIAYRQFIVPEDSTIVQMTFNWQARGETTYDYARAFIIPDNMPVEVANTFVNINGIVCNRAASYGTNSNTTVAFEGTYCVPKTASRTTYALNQVTDWQTSEYDYTLGAAGKYKVVFMWTNDESGGSQKPLAVNYLKLVNKGTPTSPYTAIDNINTTEQAEKIIRNNQVLILHNGKIYTILGTELH